MKQSQMTVFQILETLSLQKLKVTFLRCNQYKKPKMWEKNTISVETQKNQFGYWMVTNRLFKMNLYLFKG